MVFTNAVKLVKKEFTPFWYFFEKIENWNWFHLELKHFGSVKVVFIITISIHDFFYETRQLE